MIPKTLLNDLAALASEENLRLGDDIGADFCHDELPGGKEFKPDAVVEVKTTEEVSAILKACSDAGVPVVVRGAGTGKAGGSVPVMGGVVLSVKGMNSVLSVDSGAKAITVQPGVLLQDVKTEAAKAGLYYPVDPGEKTATIGGNAATDAAGPCAVKYGRTADYVLDATLVLADGSIVKLSDDERYKCVIGSEGTLAVITELTLRLIDKPAKDVILLLPFVDTESCVNAAVKLIAADFAPAVAEYLDTDMVEFSSNVTGNPVFPIEMDGERVGATLMLTLEGENDDELDEKMEQIADMMEELECLDILVVDTPTLKRDVWDAHDAFHTSTETAKSENEMNIDVPTDAYAQMVELAKSKGDELGLKVLCYGHVGSGGLHIHALSELAHAEAEASFKALADEVYTKCASLGGDISGEYGIGYGKKKYISAEAAADFKAKKAIFDPQNILNPGKVTD